MGRWGSVGRSPLGGLNFSESRQTGKKRRVGKKAKVRPSYLIFLLENPAVTGARQIWRSLHKEKCCTAIDLADLRTELRVPANNLLQNSRLSSLVNIPNWPPLASFQTAFFYGKELVGRVHLLFCSFLVQHALLQVQKWRRGSLLLLFRRLRTLLFQPAATPDDASPLSDRI